MKPLLFIGFSVLLLPPHLSAQTPDQKKATIAYVRELQDSDGGFRASANAKTSGLRNTVGALRALRYFGGEARDRAACVPFVKSCFDRATGGFADRPGGKPDPVLTAIGLMALVELKMPTEDYAGPAIKYLNEHAKTFEEVRMAAAGLEAIHKTSTHNPRWLAQLAKMANDHGTFGEGTNEVRVTGSVAAAILRLGGTLEHRAQVIDKLKNGQRSDGGYGGAETAASELGTSYRVVRSLAMLKEKPADVPKLRTFIAKCRNNDGGYGVSPGQTSSASATYFAGIILHWIGA